MTRNELIALVALSFIKKHLKNERIGTIRFCLLGLESSLVCSIANAVMADPETSPYILIKIPSHFNVENRLPDAVISNQSITHWRHYPLTGSYRAVLFAASQEEIQANDKSIEKVTKIETDILRNCYYDWVQSAGLSQHVLDKQKKELLCLALESANTVHAARTIETFADFVIAVADAIKNNGLPVQKAIDYALPSLQLPRNSGQFDRIPDGKRHSLAEWNKIFRHILSKVRPYLVLQTAKGEPIEKEKIQKNFQKISEKLSGSQKKVIKSFIESDLRIDNWTLEQEQFVELDWNITSGLFEGVNKRSAIPLNRETLNFFKDEYENVLDDIEVGLLSKSFPKEPSEDLKIFFESYFEYISQNKKLATKWEKYIYKNPKTHNDFYIALLDTIHILRRRVNDEDLREKRLLIRIPNGNKKSFWNSKNPKIARYFALRYKGFDKLFCDNVKFDFGKLYDFYFPNVDEELALITSESKEARTIKFEMIFDPDGINEKLIFYWEMPVNAMAISLADDLNSIANFGQEYALLSTANLARHRVSMQEGVHSISLIDARAIRDVTGTNNAILVDPNDNTSNCGQKFLNSLHKYDFGFNDTVLKNIETKFSIFLEDYTEAIRDWIGSSSLGISSPSLIKQAESFSLFIDFLLKNADNDFARDRLWKSILRIGIVNFSAGGPAAIVTPWHPLRLAEIHIKAKQVSDLIQKIIVSERDDIERADLFFSQTEYEFSSNYYPELCIGFVESEPNLLVATETLYDYSLAELPIKSSNEIDSDGSNLDSQQIAKAFREICEQYLKLLPHESNNFSVLLYNNELNRLPNSLASEISDMLDLNEQLQCELLISHTNKKVLANLYEQQNLLADIDANWITTSETSESFLSRLTMRFTDESSIPSDVGVRPVNIVALQDIAANLARIVWKLTPSQRQPKLIEHIPSSWSRFKPVGSTDTSVSKYLTCPVQPKEGQVFINFIYKFLEGNNALQGDILPAREIQFREGGALNKELKRVHDIAEWVVNYDELIEQRLLFNSGISIIRHIRDKQSRRNLIVSTTTQPKLLKVLLEKRLNKIDPTLLNDFPDLTKKLISSANELSGQVVMRAALYGHYANELLGIVLSKQEIQKKLGSRAVIGWYFLDDFASWFGQKEDSIADIMAISPRIENGIPVLRIIISEAKFVNSTGYKAQAKKSAKQLRDTFSRLSRALKKNKKRIDYKIWLDRIGDFMLEGLSFFGEDLLGGWTLHEWSDEVRRGNVPIELMGVSHVFVHDDREPIIKSVTELSLKGMDCTQEIFDRQQVASKLRSFICPDQQLEENYLDSLRGTNLDKIAIKEEGGSINRIQKKPFKIDEENKKNLSGPDVRDENDGSNEPQVSSHFKSNQGKSLKSDDNNFFGWPSQGLYDWIHSEQFNEEDSDENKVWLDETVRRLRRALLSYDLSADLLGARITPNAALIRFRGSDDLTIPKVEKKKQELLTSHAIEVIDILAAPSEIIIMVKRPTRAVLSLKEIWKKRKLPFTAPQFNSNIVIAAKESDGELLYLNVGGEFSGLQQHSPHTLVAGQTGSGKGVLVQIMLLDICATNSPDMARIKMIDPKAGIDFPWLIDMPHLDGELVTEQQEAIHVFDELVEEMERRNVLLASARVGKLESYNQKVDASERLPRIWLFHDELADWMLDEEYKNAVESNAIRLAQKGRSAGINLVLVTQRPDKDALPVMLRANLGNRLILKMADERNSRLVLDEPGAEKLLGKGHLAAKLSGESEIILAQVPFISEDEIWLLADIIKEAWLTKKELILD